MDNLDKREGASLVSQTVRGTVESRVRLAIVENHFAPGTHLSDRLLGEEFGASRNVVREVVRVLESEGLVTVIANRGPFVSIVTAAEAVQIYELRGALEALAGEGFATRASEDERAALEAVFEELCAFKSKDQRALSAIKERFYSILLTGCRNRFVEETLRQFLNRIAQLRMTTMASPGRLPNTIREMGRIMTAIRNRDGDGAAQACRDHVRAASVVAGGILREREAAALEDDQSPPRRSQQG
jgi:DNA-binding GntR family transcriptional regulator